MLLLFFIQNISVNCIPSGVCKNLTITVLNTYMRINVKQANGEFNYAQRQIDSMYGVHLQLICYSLGAKQLECITLSCSELATICTWVRRLLPPACIKFYKTFKQRTVNRKHCSYRKVALKVALPGIFVQ